MADHGHVHPEYAEDVDDMILEYLIYSTTKVFIDDYFQQTENNGGAQAQTQPQQKASTQLHILDDFTRIYQAKYDQRKFEDEIRFWLELLELVVHICCRHSDLMQFSTSSDVPRHHLGWNTDPLLLARRRFWLWARRIKSVTSEEQSIYHAWKEASSRSAPESSARTPHLTPSLASIISLFFLISAKMAHSIDQSISQQWAELAGEFMLQVAIESCQASPESGNKHYPPIVAFSWGWVPVARWRDYNCRDDSGLESERMINEMFEAKGGQGKRENLMWQEARLRYLSAFDVSKCNIESPDKVIATQLERVAEQYPLRPFEKKLMEFLKAVWTLFRKPILIQIEEGHIDGMTDDEFQDFKIRVFGRA